MATGSDDSHVWSSWDQASCSDAERPLADQVPVSEPSQETSSCLNATEWPLRRYGRFMPGVLATTSGSWKVLESNKESGPLILTIVISGHFFISREKEVLEGFSLIDASQWLKIVRNADCMLFGSKTKNKHRMFRVQFAGDSKIQAEEHCYNCGQKLIEYVSIQVTDIPRQELQQCQTSLLNSGSQLKDAEQNVPVRHTAPPIGHAGCWKRPGPCGQATERQPFTCPTCVGTRSPPLPRVVVNLPPVQERISVAELAQHVLTSNSELPLAYQQSIWKAEDLGSFIRLCLLDRNFPAFVEEVERQLAKITES